MMQGLKLAALFMGYSLVGYSGDYAVGLIAHEPTGHSDVVVDVRVDPPEVDVRVDVKLDERFGHSSSCEFEVERRVALSASAARLLRLRAGSGELDVQGREGLDQIEAVGRVCASDESYLDELQLTLDRDGEEIVLSAHYPDRSRRSRWGGRDYARIDLAVQVPMGMAVDVEDSSGSMEIRGTGALTIDDSSGEIRVTDVTGPVSIDDSSGGITVRGVRGDVAIDDGSGEVEVSDVEGTVRLRDGSGPLNVDHVSRDVIVDRDGSGSISVRDVDGDFRVRADGSGGIRYSGVAGNVDVPAKKRHSRRGGD